MKPMDVLILFLKLWGIKGKYIYTFGNVIIHPKCTGNQCKDHAELVQVGVFVYSKKKRT